MRFIEKNRRQPSLLLRHSRLAHADFYNLSQTEGAKDQLKRSLLKEQGHICCYCMQRITFDDMKVEHWASQAEFPERQLSYQNLLGACMGGQGSASHLQHCDTRKGDAVITVNPVDRNRHCETRIRYMSSGEITSKDANINHDINVTLNLNFQTLKQNRARVLQLALVNLGQRHAAWPPKILLTEIERWSDIDREGKLPEYCGVVISYLRDRLKKAR